MADAHTPDSGASRTAGTEPNRFKPQRSLGLSSIRLDRDIATLSRKSRGGFWMRDGFAEPQGQSKLVHATLQALDASLSMGNSVPWLVLGLGAGLVTYFALPYEPMLWALLPIAGALALLSWAGRHGAGLYLALFALAVVLGVALGAGKARLSDAPQVLREGTRMVTGTIARVEQTSASRARLTLQDLVLERVDPANTPALIRITVIADAGTLASGERIEVLARLGPPPEPVMPGARNLRRELYFAGIGATGFSFGRPTVFPEGVARISAWARAANAIANTRTALAHRFSEQLAGDTGVLAATLLVGMRDGLSDEAYEALRRAGLAHLLAISGMHMAMMTLSAIAVLHLALALHPGVSASRNALRWAGLTGLVIAAGYLLLSGASTATQRAFIMIAIALVAMIIARRALTVRAVAFAALVVLLIHPESLLGPSFQMSFAATLALVAVYGAASTSPSVWRVRMKLRDLRRGWANWALKPASMVFGIAATSLIAGLATAPFAAYHFSVGAPLSLLGNVLALPLVSFIIMPAGLLAMLLTPFALEGLPLIAMGFGIDQVMRIAYWVAAMDGSQVMVPSLTPQSLVLLSLAGCLAAFLVGKARALALPVLALMPLVGIVQPTPSMIIEQGAATVAILQTGPDGPALDRSNRRGSSFAVQMWHQRLALPNDADTEPPTTQWTCDPLGCIYPLQGAGMVSHVLDVAALEEDCASAIIVISALDVPAGCRASLIVDGATLRDHGAIALLADDSAASGYRIWPTFVRRTRPWEAVAPR